MGVTIGSPAAGASIAATQPLSFTLDGRVLVYAHYAGLPGGELIWDGDAFSPLFVASSKIGDDFSVVRPGGWPGDVTLKFIDLDGGSSSPPTRMWRQASAPYTIQPDDSVIAAYVPGCTDIYLPDATLNAGRELMFFWTGPADTGDCVIHPFGSQTIVSWEGPGVPPSFDDQTYYLVAQPRPPAPPLVGWGQIRTDVQLYCDGTKWFTTAGYFARGQRNLRFVHTDGDTLGLDDEFVVFSFPAPFVGHPFFLPPVASCAGREFILVKPFDPPDDDEFSQGTVQVMPVPGEEVDGFGVFGVGEYFSFTDGSVILFSNGAKWFYL
jgi:hypothetical protein